MNNSCEVKSEARRAEAYDAGSLGWFRSILSNLNQGVYRTRKSLEFSFKNFRPGKARKKLDCGQWTGGLEKPGIFFNLIKKKVYNLGLFYFCSASFIKENTRLSLKNVQNFPYC